MSERPSGAFLLWVQRCYRDTEDKQMERQYNSTDNFPQKIISAMLGFDGQWSLIAKVIVSFRYSQKLTWRRRSAAAIREVCLNTDKLIRTVWSSLTKRLNEEDVYSHWKHSLPGLVVK